MTKPALLTEADAKRFARVAKSEGVAVRIESGGKEITIFPNIPEIHKDERLDAPEVIKL